MERKLFRSKKDKVIAGVCGGLGDFFQIDSIIFRLVFLGFVFYGGVGLILYLICLILIPVEEKKSLGEETKCGDADFVADVSEKTACKEDKRVVRKQGTLLLGCFFVLMGLSILFKRLGFFEFNIGRYLFSFFSYWPIGLILLGSMILPIRKPWKLIICLALVTLWVLLSLFVGESYVCFLGVNGF